MVERVCNTGSEARSSAGNIPGCRKSKWTWSASGRFEETQDQRGKVVNFMLISKKLPPFINHWIIFGRWMHPTANCQDVITCLRYSFAVKQSRAERMRRCSSEVMRCLIWAGRRTFAIKIRLRRVLNYCRCGAGERHCDEREWSGSEMNSSDGLAAKASAINQTC